MITLTGTHSAPTGGASLPHNSVDFRNECGCAVDGSVVRELSVAVDYFYCDRVDLALLGMQALRGRGEQLPIVLLRPM